MKDDTQYSFSSFKNEKNDESLFGQKAKRNKKRKLFEDENSNIENDIGREIGNITGKTEKISLSKSGSFENTIKIEEISIKKEMNENNSIFDSKYLEKKSLEKSNADKKNLEKSNADKKISETKTLDKSEILKNIDKLIEENKKDLEKNKLFEENGDLKFQLDLKISKISELEEKNLYLKNLNDLKAQDIEILEQRIKILEEKAYINTIKPPKDILLENVCKCDEINSILKMDISDLKTELKIVRREKDFFKRAFNKINTEEFN